MRHFHQSQIFGEATSHRSSISSKGQVIKSTWGWGWGYQLVEKVSTAHVGSTSCRLTKYLWERPEPAQVDLLTVIHSKGRLC